MTDTVFRVAFATDGRTSRRAPFAIEGFEKDAVHAAITMPDHKLPTLTGSWTRLD